MIGTFCDQAEANFQQGRKLFQQGRYAPAASLFFNAMAYARNRKEKRDAEWFLAESLRNMRLYYSASKYYSLIVVRGLTPGNRYFRPSMERLGEINQSLSLGQSHIAKLFSKRIDPSAVPGPARGFYFYYLGVERFSRQEFEPARNFFRKVPFGSAYGPGALFHRGIIANLNGNYSRAIELFQKVLNSTPREGVQSNLRIQASLNIARALYETKRFERALKFYGQVPRDSQSNWLQAIWESAWAFFMLEKHNNTLGQIHTIQSPFFENRFYPESYILQAITFLRLCRFDRVTKSLRGFKKRYKPVFVDVSAVRSRYKGDPRGFFKLVTAYESRSLKRYRNAFEVLDVVSKSDAYQSAIETIRNSNREIDLMRPYGGQWRASGLLNELRSFLDNKRSVAQRSAGRKMYRLFVRSHESLKDLSDQTGLIQAERMLGKVDELRKKLNVTTAKSKTVFIGGLKELELGSTLEYWPFIPNEYWEDELGYYVYNIDSQCTRRKGGRK